MGLYIPKPDQRDWLYALNERVRTTPGDFAPPDSGQIVVVDLAAPIPCVAIIYSPKEAKRFLTGRTDGIWWRISADAVTGMYPTALDEWRKSDK